MSAGLAVCTLGEGRISHFSHSSGSDPVAM